MWGLTCRAAVTSPEQHLCVFWEESCPLEELPVLQVRALWLGGLWEVRDLQALCVGGRGLACRDVPALVLACQSLPPSPEHRHLPFPATTPRIGPSLKSLLMWDCRVSRQGRADLRQVPLDWQAVMAGS